MAELRAVPSLADYGPQGPAAVLIAEADSSSNIAIHALEDAGIGLRERIDFATVRARLTDHSGLDLIVIDAAGAPDMLFDTVLARADTLARERPLCVVASVTRDQVDAAVAHLMGPRTQILCDATPADWVTALALARAQAAGFVMGSRAMPVMDDARREGEVARLRRLNEEVARIADTLARLTRGEEPNGGAVRAPAKGYRGPEETGNGEAVEATAQEIRTVIRARRLRDQFFADALFADPAWDMLLDLYAARLEARPVSVSSLCIAAAVPPTTALRWIGTMHETGLFERHADPSDRRRAYIALSDKGVAAMRAYVTAAKKAGLGLV